MTHRCTIIDRDSHFPITLRSMEQYCIVVSIKPFSRFEGSETKSKFSTVAVGNSPVTPPAQLRPYLNTTQPRRGSFVKKYLDQTSAPDGRLSPDESGMTVFETSMSVHYSVEGLERTFTRFHPVQWASVLPRGLFAQVKVDAPNESVPLREPFLVSILLTNYTTRNFDLLVTNQLLSSSTLVCQDACVNVGYVILLFHGAATNATCNCV